jgi:hypothetical protein
MYLNIEPQAEVVALKILPKTPAMLGIFKKICPFAKKSARGEKQAHIITRF